MDIKPLDTEQIGLKTLEKHLMRSKSEVSLKIGLPKEISFDERRVSLTPGGASILKANGHEIFIEKGAGEDANFPDHEYADAGAEIAYSPDDVFKKSDLILKIAPLTKDEFKLLQPGQALISALHMGSQTEDYLKALTEKSITGIGYEFIRGEDKEFPIVRMMHEITGSMSVQIAAHYLESMSGGQGIMLGGISGVPPATVVILGAGITGEYAARTALGYGAQVFVMDTDLTALRRLENALDRRIITAVANHQYLSTALKFADIIIGAAMAEGERSPCWVTDEMVAGMKAGSVIVDTVIDQGGCVATSRPTTHSNPVYSEHDVIHHCVPNIPANVPRTATYALNNVLVPYILAIGNAGGVKECLWENVALRNGTYSYKKHITKKTLAKMFDMPYREIEMLIASQI
ncbi:MAG: alanine dehydrogenase [Gracilimonas sp.]|uniref:alanine dehydrogenase n=1 Tax=Gracilimonas sp. TaxID=1974203 RepID=UPI001B0941DA|nr:alanine dehydrogenase [Gracilimonas sp.]MBO6585708.1 alanine dehydrogenase [Gracilimonas sp.]MBO6616705.1 alanine dehydrogenase [Gracilimonas sp.]